MIKGFKIRLFPTKEQEAKLWQHIGACRFIWNYMLAEQNAVYERGEKHMSGFDMINRLKPLKNDGEHEWLYEVSHISLQSICRDLDKDFKRFFKDKHGYPKFKSRKRDKPRYPVRSNSVYFTANLVNIEKIGKVKYKTDFDLPEGKDVKITNARITYKSGKWMLGFGMECESQAPVLNEVSVGIDLGVKELAVVAAGDDEYVFHNINKSRRMRELKRKLRYTQRSISRKYEANRVGKVYVKTENIKREEDKLRRIHQRIADIRTDYIHQATHKIISILPKRVVMEDLNVRGMMKNKHLSEAIGEQCFAEFERQMKYKCEWNGIEFIQVGKFYPSSKMCSCCGEVKQDLKLSDRIYICGGCGLTIDRDYNAALNLTRYAG